MTYPVCGSCSISSEAIENRRMESTLTSRERLEAAWNHAVPDRVPVELTMADEVRDWPEARRIREFVENQADNFLHVPAADWGFFGLPAERCEEITDYNPTREKP
jgi:hypothetical protein